MPVDAPNAISLATRIAHILSLIFVACLWRLPTSSCATGATSTAHEGPRLLQLANLHACRYLPLIPHLQTKWERGHRRVNVHVSLVPSLPAPRPPRNSDITHSNPLSINERYNSPCPGVSLPNFLREVCLHPLVLVRLSHPRTLTNLLFILELVYRPLITINRLQHPQRQTETPLKAASHLRYNNRPFLPSLPSLIRPHLSVRHHPRTAAAIHQCNSLSKQSRNRFNDHNNL